jgi:hypothetical protein
VLYVICHSDLGCKKAFTVLGIGQSLRHNYHGARVSAVV